MKKPSKRSCTVCPKNHQDDEDPEKESVRTKFSPSVIKNPRWRKIIAARKRTAAQLANRRKRANAPKRRGRRSTRRRPPAKVTKSQSPKVVQPKAKPQDTSRTTSIKSNNQYYGIDYKTEIVNPQVGDTFTSTITGDKFFYNKGLWNLIPPPSGPRSYYGDIVNHEAREGDLYLRDNQISVYQNGEWNHIKIPKQNQTNQTLINLDDMICKVKYLDVELNPLHPLKFNETLKCQVSLQGQTNLELIPIEPKGINLEIILGSWIKYSDDQGIIWQTVLALGNLILFDQDHQVINDYKLIYTDSVIDLPELKLLTTKVDQAKIKVETAKIVSKIEMSPKLLAYQSNIDDSEFFSVKFNDLKKHLDLPDLEIIYNFI